MTTLRLALASLVFAAGAVGLTACQTTDTGAGHGPSARHLAKVQHSQQQAAKQQAAKQKRRAKAAAQAAKPHPTKVAHVPSPAAYYENCDAARAAGVAPLHRGDPGYDTNLDRDGDGVACEE